MNGQELMQKILRSYEHSFDLTAPCEVNGHTYDAYANYNESGAKYVLTKKAELWRVSCYENVYFRAVPELTEAVVDEFIGDFTDWIEPMVVRGGKEVPDADHMYTFVTGIFFADTPVAEEVQRRIRKYRFYKNYRFSLRGYCQVRLLVFDVGRKKVLGNAAARELRKGYNKVFRP